VKVKITASVPMAGQCGIDCLIGKTFDVTNKYECGDVQIEVPDTEWLSGAVSINKNEYEVIEA
jgi:hypothetical protein